MRAKHLLLFRAVLIEVLLFQILYSPILPDVLRAWVWCAFLPYAAWAGAVHVLDWKGKIPRSRHLWFFFVDIAMTSLILTLTHGLSSDLYIAYFLVILASCLLDNLKQSFLIGGVACVVYAALAFPGRDAVLEPHYLLRLSLLLVISFFSAYVVDQAHRLEEATREKVEEALAWMQRLSLVGKAITHVLHETKTPLNTIILSAESIREGDATGPEAREQLELICAEAERASKILENYLEFTRPTQLNLKPLPVAPALERVLQSMSLRMAEQGVALAKEIDRDAFILGSERHLVQAFTNIIDNALNAMALGGTLRVRQWREKGHVVISFLDSGLGIPPEKLSLLFKPDAAFSHEGPGHGLGLSITLWILQKHSGTMELHSPGLRQGTEALVRLPASEKVNQ